jgi:ornithine cyclodeaminase/alanine dehydrogenase-like protein (mu-crystallin family)
MRYLNSSDTREALPMADAIRAMEHAFSGDTEAPLRSLVGNSLVMPGRLDDIIAVKIVSTAPGNPAGLVVVLGPDGSPLGLVHGPTLTAIRTGAVSGLATSLLARRDASTLAMLGAGAMAFDQVAAVQAVRPIERVLVWSREKGNARSFADLVGGEPVADADAAVAQADVISCATPARHPLFTGSMVRESAHVNAVGAFTPEMVELPPELLERAYVVVDDIEAAAAEAGDLIQAGRYPNTTLRELLAGTHPEIGEDVTVFKSVGVAAQDVAAAHLALVKAEQIGLGTFLPG